MNELKIKRGTQAAYDKIATKDPDTIYFITDTKRIYIGSDEFSRPTECVADLAFIVNNADVHAITKLD